LSRVLWIGDAGAATGLGRVTREIVIPLARDRGHDIHILGINYKGDPCPEQQYARVYKANLRDATDTFGTLRVAEIVNKVDPEVVVIVHGPAAVWQYLFENPYDEERALLARPIISYCPVDGYDYPPDWLEVLPRATNFVAMSKFGQETYKPSGLAYHGVDTEAFYPVSPERPIRIDGNVLTSKAECKAYFNMDAQFLALRVDTNSGRKDYAATIKALGPFLEQHRDAAAHFHASTDPRMPGIHIARLLNRFDSVDVTLSDLTDPWPDERLLTLYNAADVFITTSRGEGFGLTIAEALACGVPVVAQKCSAIPEVVGPGGILIDPIGAITVPASQDLRLPDIPAFTSALELLYRNEELRLSLGAAGREHVTESFRWTDAVDAFHDFIETLATRWRSSQEAQQT